MKKTKLCIILLLSLLVTSIFAEDESLQMKAVFLKTFPDRIELTDVSRLSNKDLFLRSKNVIIYKENGSERRIDADGDVYVEFDTGSATSVTLDYDLQEEKGTLTGNVEAFIISSSSSETIAVKCDVLDIDNAQKLFNGRMNDSNQQIDLKRGDLMARSAAFEYKEQDQKLTLYQNVYIDDVENNRIITGDLIVINLQDDSIEGNNVSIKDKDGDSFEINSNNFKMFEDKTEFYSFSTIQKDNFKLSSPRFTVFKENGKDKQVVTQQRSYVEFDTGKATSDTLDYDLELEKGILEGDVEALLIPQEDATEVNIKCDHLETDGVNKVYSGYVESGKKVYITRGDIYAESEEFEYVSNDSLLVLKKSAYIDDLENSQRLWGSIINLNLDDNAISGTDIRMTRTQESEDGESEQIQMRSKNFHMYDDRDEFIGPSEIIRKGLELVSDRFTIFKTDGKQETIEATQGVYIKFDSGSATSTELLFDLDTSEGTLTKDVFASIQQANTAEMINVQSDVLNLNETTGQYSGHVTESEKVLIKKGNMEAESKSFEYSKSEEKLILIDEVYVYDPDNKRTISGDRLVLYLATDESEGENIEMTIITKE